MTGPKVKKKRTLFRKIVNVFLGIFIGIFILIVLFIGFSQTKTFREFLRGKIIEIANNNINGKLNIQRIDGSILTSIILRSTLLTYDQDTILYAKKIELETSPLRILLKQIHIRNFELSDANIELIKDNNGRYNFSKLFKPSPKDTTKSTFPFSIRISSLNLTNVNLKVASLENKYSNKSYPFLYLDDFRIDNLYLTLNAYANLNKKDFLINLEEMKCKTNLSNFTLKNLAGKIGLTGDYAKITNLMVETKGTNFILDAELKDFHLFNNFNYAQLKKSPVSLKLTTRIFNFSELSGFVPATDLLKGTIKTTIYASGKYGNMKVDKIAIDYLKTHLEGTAVITDLNDPKNLFINAHLTNSYLNQPDLAQLLPGVGMPVYKDLQINNINIDFEGRPNNFTTKLSGDFPKGKFASNMKFDFASGKMKYDVGLSTSQLDLSPLLNSPTNMNLNLTAQGEGTNLRDLTLSIRFKLLQSSFQQYKIDSLKIFTSAKNGIFDIRMNSLAESVKLRIRTNIDFNNVRNPVYHLTGNVSNINLERLLKNPKMASNINFGFDVRGNSFDPDSMNTKLIFKLDSSKIASVSIHPTEIVLNYKKSGDGGRIINLNSDLADLSVTGRYSLKDAIPVIGYEYKTISNLVIQKINSINPWAFFKDTTKAREYNLQLAGEENIPEYVNNNFDMNYELVIRDLSEVKAISGFKDLSVEGKISGGFKNSNEKFESAIKTELNRIKLISHDNIVYVSNFNLNFIANRDNRTIAPENIFGKLDMSIARVFSGTDLKNFNLNLKLDKNILSSKLSAQLDTSLTTNVSGLADFSKNNVILSFDTLFIKYKNFEWKNDGVLSAVYNKDFFELQHFRMVRNGSALDLSGLIYGNGAENLSFKIVNLDLDFINVLAGFESRALTGNIFLDGQFTGYLHDPIIKMQLNIDNIVARGARLGFLRTNFDYGKKLLNTDIKFMDSTLNMSNPLLVISGVIPINLAFVGASERIIKDKEINLTVKSNNFDLSLFENIVPMVKDLHGKLITDLNIGGYIDKLDLNGDLHLSNTSFTLLQNNLPYSLEMGMAFNKSSVILESFNLRNAGKTTFKGRLFGEGNYNFDDKTGELRVRGDLTVLSQASKAAVPYLYGNITIGSQGDWVFTYKNNSGYFDGVVLIKNMDVTVPQIQSSYSTSGEYIYRYVVDSSKINKSEEEFNNFLALTKKTRPSRTINLPKSFNFGYKVKIHIEDEASLNIILNQEANQKLTALLNGDLFFENGGIAQGEFKLLEGSELTFFKTFTAGGKIYFDNSITNPRLDIVATYQSAIGDTAVAVKIKLEGPVDQLGENLAKNPNNIAVYITQNNIDKNVPAPDKTPADAITFILVGKFLSGLTTGDKAAMSSFLNPQEYTNSALSGVLSAFANKYLGDVVRNIELEQTGTSTRLSVSGKIQKLKYSLGTKTEEFQDISKANLKLEYPITENFIIRFERKDPILENVNTTEKVNEIAIKYNFMF